MNGFLDKLFFYCIQKEPPPRDAQYRADRDTLAQMEEQIEAVMGQEFWERYARAAFQCGEQEEASAFRAGLRFGVDLIQNLRQGV